MSGVNWIKVLSVHVKPQPTNTRPGFIVYRDPKEVLEERTMIIHAVEQHERMIAESLPDEEELEAFEREMFEIFTRVLH